MTQPVCTCEALFPSIFTTTKNMGTHKVYRPGYYTWNKQAMQVSRSEVAVSSTPELPFTQPVENSQVETTGRNDGKSAAGLPCGSITSKMPIPAKFVRPGQSICCCALSKPVAEPTSRRLAPGILNCLCGAWIVTHWMWVH